MHICKLSRFRTLTSTKTCTLSSSIGMSYHRARNCSMRQVSGALSCHGNKTVDVQESGEKRSMIFTSDSELYTIFPISAFSHASCVSDWINPDSVIIAADLAFLSLVTLLLSKIGLPHTERGNGVSIHVLLRRIKRTSTVRGSMYHLYPGVSHA